jgi:hypothetical protein
MNDFQEMGRETADIFPVRQPIVKIVSPQKCSMTALKLYLWNFAQVENL